MKKLLSISILGAALLMPISINASTVHVLRDEAFDVDTLKHYKNGPGMTYTELRYQSQTRPGKHFTAFVITTDLKNSPNLDFRMHLGCDSVHTSEKITTVAQRRDNANNQYIAAINGDFFITWSSTPGMLGYPNMTACTNGEMALSDNVDHSNHIDAWIMDHQRGMWCDQTVLNNTLTWPDGTSASIYGVNYARRDDSRLDATSDAADIVFYNQHRGKYTGSAAGWTEVTVRPIEGAKWRINSPVQLEVTAAPRTGGHTAIPRDGAVIAAGPDAAAPVAALKVGDIVTLNIGLSLPSFDNIRPDVKEVVGGDVTLLRNGEAVMTANRFINARDSENPRTMVGYDADRTIMVWCAVDGRSGNDTGCTYPQGAEIMRHLGCTDAINFDGGGSTVMWLEQPGIVNSPSDGKERAVGNGLYAVITAPEDDQIAEIRFMDWSKQLPQYGHYNPTIYGYNQYGQLIDTDVEGFTLSAPEELGTINGNTLLADGSGCHTLTAHLGELQATIVVNIAPTTEITFGEGKRLIDNIHQWKVDAYTPIDGEPMLLSPEALSWISDAPSVATIDADANLVGIANGVANISGAIGDLSANVEVTVECPTATYMDVPDDLSQWTVRATGATASLSQLPTGGLAIDYTITNTRNASVTLEPIEGATLWSVPDALCLEVRPSGVNILKETVKIEPYVGTSSSHTFSNLAAGEVHRQDMPMSLFFDNSLPNAWPASISSISFSLRGSGSGRIELPLIATQYDAFSGVPSLPVDDNGIDPSTPIEYYNLQGIRITNPTPGNLYIRRQGNKATRVIL